MLNTSNINNDCNYQCNCGEDEVQESVLPSMELPEIKECPRDCKREEMIMKTLIRTFILFFCITGLASCYAGIPLKSGKSENNQTYEVSYLFEHDGVKVYRFLDLGNYVYFTTRGDVTSIKNDSTRKRTITIYKDSIPNR